ncbi:MAG: cytoplasmic protein [Syntrophobacterales bacterium]|nr:cytoplasmic protein [Syntrophobacterales bacterium]
MAKRHSHNFVNRYDGMVAFGFSREIDEKSIMYLLQKFTDDEVLEVLVPRMTNEELSEVFEMITRLLKSHLSDEEYHRLFIKDDR